MKYVVLLMMVSNKCIGLLPQPCPVEIVDTRNSMSDCKQAIDAIGKGWVTYPKVKEDAILYCVEAWERNPPN